MPAAMPGPPAKTGPEVILPHRDGCLLLVRVMPRASRDGIAGPENGALKVRLTAPPVGGAANQALIKLLAKALKLPKGGLTIVSGQTSRNKRVAAAGLDPAEAARRLGL